MSIIKSLYQKRGYTDGDPVNCFLRANTYIGFKIVFLKILNKELRIFSKGIVTIFANSWEKVSTILNH